MALRSDCPLSDHVSIGALRNAGYTVAAMAQSLRELECVLQADGRYHADAFAFLLTGLEASATRQHGPRSGDQSRHISGQQLSLGLRDCAIERWGPLAPLVLQRWGIRRTRDFGEMVFLLIDAGVLSKQPSDRIEDFDEVFAFDGAFEKSPHFDF